MEWLLQYNIERLLLDACLFHWKQLDCSSCGAENEHVDIKTFQNLFPYLESISLARNWFGSLKSESCDKVCVPNTRFQLFYYYCSYYVPGKRVVRHGCIIRWMRWKWGARHKNTNDPMNTFFIILPSDSYDIHPMDQAWHNHISITDARKEANKVYDASCKIWCFDG